MRLALSSAAAPTLSAAELFAACARRGMDAVELVQGHSHGLGIGSSDADLRRVLDLADAAGVRIVAFRTTGDLAGTAEAAELSARLGVPVIAPPGSRERARTTLRGIVARYGAAGGQILLAHSGDLADVQTLREIADESGAYAGLAWDLDPTAHGVIVGGPPGGERTAATAPAPVGVLAASGPRLRHIRLLGGGPEASGQEGLGIGELAVGLALSSYAGALTLAPSTPRYLTAWGLWLERPGRRGWGCGSKAEPLPITQLGGAA